MNEDKDKLSFHESEEEEFHVTDEDIDRELASLHDDHHPIDASTESSDESFLKNEKLNTAGNFSKIKRLKRKHWLMIAILVMIILFAYMRWVNKSASDQFDAIPATLPSSTQDMVGEKKSSNVLSNSPVKAGSNTSNASALAEPNLPISSSAESNPKPDLGAVSLPSKSFSEKESFSAPVAPKIDLAASPSSETKLVQTLEALQQQNALLTQQLTTLSSRMEGLESSFNQANQAVEGLSQQVVEMRGEGEDKVNAHVAAPPAEASISGPQYTVEAVVPQRAWLQTASGATLTVMMGDDVPSLGSVTGIDPYTGNVTTSSGVVIKYAN